MTDSIMYHEGNRRLQDQFESRRIPTGWKNLRAPQFTEDDQAFIESAAVFLSCHGRCRRTAGLLVQGRHAGLRERYRGIRARLSRL